MPVSEGLCPNCGSLIQVDSAQPDTRCIFCWAPVDADLAQSLLADPSNYEFPNEAYQQPTEAERRAHMLEQMGQTQMAQQVLRQQPQPRKPKEDKMSPAEKVKLMTRPIVEPVASKKSITIMIAGILGFLLLFFGIFTPLYLSRTAKQATLTEKLNKVVPFDLDEKNISLEGQRNHSLMIVSPEEVTEEVAGKAYEEFALLYSDVYNISEEVAKDRIEVEILGPNGGFFLDKGRVDARKDLDPPPVESTGETDPASEADTTAAEK